MRNMLHELFPSSPDSLLQVLALSSLLEIIVGFRFTDQDGRLRSVVMDIYKRYIDENLPESLPAEVLASLATMDYQLEELCLFKLHPYPPMSGSSGGGWGFATQPIQVGDMMIPLWQLG